ncbi:hypothetical protein FOA52_012970 [Chlamydomonas sp. UWO 241]|nr:hypothetical protein FOA52_012970 [Chlamydomonas sp. UWO 241]
MAAENETRPTDYGACAFQANQSFYIEAALIKPVGIRETCAWEKTDVLDEFMPPVVEQTIGDNNPPIVTSGFVVSECVTCMDATYQYADARIPGVLGTQPINTSKVLFAECGWGAYACALCRHPNWMKAATEDEAIFLAKQCFACVADPNVYNAWGCNFCYEAVFLATKEGRSPPASATENCTTCVMSNPYEDKVGTYGWACAECASIADDDIRALCMTCVMAPSLMTAEFVNDTLAASLLDKDWVGMASELICSCIDMAKASTWEGSVADWYVASCPECTAMQKRRNITWAAIPNHGGVAEDPRVPFVKVVNAELPSNYTLMNCSVALTEDEKTYLATCMSKLNNVTGTKDFAYACEQYCMNTYTITNLAEHDQCNTCVSDGAALTTDPAVRPCELCIQSVSWNVFPNATDRYNRRDDCMKCVNGGPTGTDKNWACGECAKMTSEAAGTACFACLAANSVDPCACVDGIKRGWLFFAPADGGCFGQTTIDEALINGTLKGSKTVDDDYKPEQCAKIADGLGHPTFGLDNTGVCYTFPANIQYISAFPNVTTGCAKGTSACVCPFTPGAPVIPDGGPVASNSLPLNLTGKEVGQSSTYSDDPYNSGSSTYSPYTFPNGLAAVLAITPELTGPASKDVESCSHTNSGTTDAEPFWWVNLGANYVVTKVEVTGRSASTCSGGDPGKQACRDRLKGIKIYVGSALPTSSNPPSATPSNLLVTDNSAPWTASSLTKTYDATYTGFVQQTGQYLSIQTSGEALTLCDVQISGYTLAPSP